LSYSADGGLNYAQRNSGVWTTEVVDSTGTGENNLILDALGNPHISYFYDTTSDVKYAWWDGDAWVIELVDGAFSAQGYWASIGFDGDGKPMIAYTHNDKADLRFARRA
jgi:hypothetical protein